MDLEKNISRKVEGNRPNSKDSEQDHINPKNSDKAIIYSKSEAEKKFTKEEYLGIMEGAEFLREFEARKGKMSQDMISRLSLDENEVPLSRVYRLAEDLGIGSQYVDKYLEMRFPSEEQKLEDLNKYHAIPDDRTMQRSYIKTLKLSLENAFPNEEFIFKSGGFLNRFLNGESFGVFILKNKVKDGLIFKKNKIVKNREKIASVSISYSLWNLYDPCFLRVCGKNLNKLNDIYNKKPSMRYYYDVDLVK